MQDRLLTENRTILLGLPIDDKVATEVIAKMLFLKSLDDREPIQLLLNSPGGSVTASFAILDTMDNVGVPIRTSCIGQCSGTAAAILAHGTRTLRSAGRVAFVKLVKIAAGTLTDRANERLAFFERAASRLEKFMADDTGQTTDQIRKDMAEERSFTAEEARRYGFIDFVSNGEF